jgi:hypothetical protein
MVKRQVFYSFHFKNDVMRVQLIRNIGSLEGNEPVSANDWEQKKRKGDSAIEKWIDDNMKYRSCVVVLIGEETADRPWVKYEIRKAWNERKGLLGIYIHNLRCPINGKCKKGRNPFDEIKFENGSKLSSVVACYDPSVTDSYGDIAKNMEAWVGKAKAIAQRK